MDWKGRVSGRFRSPTGLNQFELEAEREIETWVVVPKQLSEMVQSPAKLEKADWETAKL